MQVLTLQIKVSRRRCGYLVNCCPYNCSFQLPDEYYSEVAFKTHLLDHHAAFDEFKSVAIPETCESDLDTTYISFKGTNLRSERFRRLRALAVQRRPKTFYLNKNTFHYLHVLHTVEHRYLFCCAYCECYFTTLNKLQLHIYLQHVKLTFKTIVKEVPFGIVEQKCILSDCNCDFGH